MKHILRIACVTVLGPAVLSPGAVAQANFFNSIHQGYSNTRMLMSHRAADRAVIKRFHQKKRKRVTDKARAVRAHAGTRGRRAHGGAAR